MNIIAERLREGRARLRLTQRQLAEKVGVSKYSIFRIESKNREPGIDELERIAAVLGVTTDYLTGRTDSTTGIKNPLAAQTERPGVNVRIFNDLIEIPVVSSERLACYGIGALDISSNSGRSGSISRSLLRAYDDKRPPFGIECSGSCLEEKGILDGDIAVINPAERPPQGVLALVSLGGTFSLKYVYNLNKGDVLLRCDDGDRRLTPDEQEDLDYWVVGTLVAISRSRPPANPL